MTVVAGSTGRRAGAGGAASNGTTAPEPSAVDTSLLRAGAKLVAPTAVLTAWLYYIGWVKTNRQASYFGIDPSLLDYSTTDYVLRSVTSLLGPAGALLISLLAVGAARRAINRVEPHEPPFRLFRAGGRLAAGVGSVLVVIGGLYLNRIGATGFASALAALALLVGGLLLLLGRYLSVLVRRRNDPTVGIEAIEMLVIGLVLAVGLFAAGFFYAVQVGEFAARSLEERLADAPEVHLLSTEDLGLPGTTGCEPLRGADSAYRCRYTGLRLLTAANDRLFLVPERWGEPANSYVHVIPADDGVRIDLRSG
ncbi:MAG: hypothetical protein AAGA93_24490 [Actinomycetota bacterium]